MKRLVRNLFIIVLIMMATVVSAQESADTPYTAESGTFLLKHPSLWIVIEDANGFIILADSFTTQFLFDEGFALESGQIVVQVFDPMLVTQSFGSDVETVFEILTEDAPPDLPAFDVSTVDINGREALSGQIGNDPLVFYVFETVDGDITLGIVNFAANERAKAEQRAINVFETVTTKSLEDTFAGNDALDLVQYYRSNENGLSFWYPDHWTVDGKQKAPSIVLASGNVAQTNAEAGVLGSRMDVVRPSTIDPSFDDDTELVAILKAAAANEHTFLFPEFVAVTEFDRELVYAYENVRTFGEVTLFMMRMDDGYIMQWRVCTADGELSIFYPTLLAILEKMELDTSKIEITDSPVEIPVVTLTKRETYRVSLEGFSNDIMDIDLNPTGYILAVGGGYTTLLINLETGAVQDGINYTGRVCSLAFSPDGDVIAVGTQASPDDRTNRVVYWKLEEGYINYNVYGTFSGPPLRLSFSPDGERLLVETDFYSPTIFDAAYGRSLFSFEEGEKGLFSSTGRYAAGTYTLLNVKAVRIIDATDFQRVSSFAMPEDQSVSDIAFNADDSRVAVSYTGFESGRDEIEVYDVETGKKITESTFTVDFPSLPALESFIDIEFSPTSNIIAASTSTGNVWVWDGETGYPLTKLSLGNYAVNALVFSHDGSRLYAGGDDTVTILDVVVEGH